MAKTMGEPIEDIESLVIYHDAVWVTLRNGETKIIKLENGDCVVAYAEEKEKTMFAQMSIFGETDLEFAQNNCGKCCKKY